jgi:hypothetical protein
MNENTMNVTAEKWLEDQFEKFDFEGFSDKDKSEVRAVFMNTMRPAVYEMVEEADRAHDLIGRQSKQLRKIVALVRGEPPPDMLWSTHDASLLVQDLADKVKAGKEALMTLAKFVENVTLKAVIEEALREIDPRRCPNCGTVDITSSMKVEKFPYHLHQGDQVEEMELEAEVRVFTCYECEQRWTDHTAEDARVVVINEMLVSKGLKRIGE